MAGSGWNHDADPRFDIDDFIIEFHLSIRFAFQKEVRFCDELVVVPSGVFTDFGDV